MKRMLLRLLTEEDGQDLIEYALLTSFIALVCISCFNLIQSAIANAYRAWNNQAYNLATPPDPSGS